MHEVHARRGHQCSIASGCLATLRESALDEKRRFAWKAAVSPRPLSGPIILLVVAPVLHRLPRVHRFTVRVRGQDVDVNRLVGDLEAAGIMVGKFAGEPPEAEHVLAQLDAENAQEAKAHVREALPPEGDYTVDEPVQID